MPAKINRELPPVPEAIYVRTSKVIPEVLRSSIPIITRVSDASSSSTIGRFDKPRT